MIHRHLDYPPDTPVDELGDAALDDLLDHGDLTDWRPLTRAIAADPFGDLAERVLRLCGANPRYGNGPLWRAWIARRRALSELPRAPDLSLAELRRRRGLSQAALAESIGMAQSDLSKAERRADWRLSTLASIAVGLGLCVQIVAVDAAGHVVGTIARPPCQASARRTARRP
jgi:DNA-binding XRE family transcriptional regulator